MVCNDWDPEKIRQHDYRKKIQDEAFADRDRLLADIDTLRAELARVKAESLRVVACDEVEFNEWVYSDCKLGKLDGALVWNDGDEGYVIDVGTCKCIDLPKEDDDCYADDVYIQPVRLERWEDE